MLLHGFADSWQVYDHVITRLAGDFHVYALDLRGHGDSDKPACCYTQADYVADVAAFMDAERIPQAALVGHSLGSFVAQNLALTHAERVERLVLVGSAAACVNPACARRPVTSPRSSDPTASPPTSSDSCGAARQKPGVCRASGVPGPRGLRVAM